MLSQRPLRLSSFLFILFSVFYGSDFHHSVLQVIHLFFCLSYSAADSFQCIIYLYLFFSCYRSLVSISCIFSILFPRFWIIFTIIILNSYSGQLPISTSFSCFSGVLSCPFIWDITHYFFILTWFLWHGFCSSHCGIVVLLALWWMRLRGLCKLPDGMDWWWEKLGFTLVGRALLSKTVIQLSADRWGCSPSLVVFWPEVTQPLGLHALWWS